VTARYRPLAVGKHLSKGTELNTIIIITVIKNMKKNPALYGIAIGRKITFKDVSK
jgi:hypothetical protein